MCIAFNMYLLYINIFEAQKCPHYILFAVLTPLFQQFSSWWPNEHEIRDGILSRDVRIYHSVPTSSMPSSRKSEEGKLFANGGVLNTIIISEPVIIYLFLSFTNSGSPFCIKFKACKIVEGQRYTKRLNEKQITSLLKVTCQRPREQEMNILQVCRQQ